MLRYKHREFIRLRIYSGPNDDEQCSTQDLYITPQSSVMKIIDITLKFERLQALEVKVFMIAYYVSK